MFIDHSNQNTVKRSAYSFILFFAALLCATSHVYAQQREGLDELFISDTIPILVDDYVEPLQESIEEEGSIFIPDPMRAVWYSALFPGAGQIYNRKYWKLPIVYGGYLGLTYALNWNQRYYKGYATAYRDLVEDNPNKSYLDYVRPGFDVNANREWLERALKRKKDSFRRNRDLSIISMAGLYLLAMVDAYVDASLYNFDISPDISMRVVPALIEPNSFHSSSVGLQCSINF